MWISYIFYKEQVMASSKKDNRVPTSQVKEKDKEEFADYKAEQQDLENL